MPTTGLACWCAPIWAVAQRQPRGLPNPTAPLGRHFRNKINRVSRIPQVGLFFGCSCLFVCLLVGWFFFAMFRSVFWFLLACFPTRLVINQYESCQSICNLCGGGQPRNAGLPNPIGPCGRCRRNLDASLSFMAREKGQKNVVPSLKEDVSADADWIVIDYFVIVSLR